MLTIFSTCRAFTDCYDFIQTNAITSWTQLDPRPEIILFGDEAGVAQISERLGCSQATDVERHPCGLPYVGSLFRAAQAQADHNLLCYVNADILLFQDFMDTALIVAGHLDRFLMIGPRWDWLKREPIDFSLGWQDQVLKTARGAGQVRPRKALDYFVFTKGVYDIDFPPLVLARYWWDPWLVWSALTRGIPVVDATDSVTVLHQQHGAAVLARRDPVARRNRELTGEEPIQVGIDAATWTISGEGLRQK